MNPRQFSGSVRANGQGYAVSCVCGLRKKRRGFNRIVLVKWAAIAVACVAACSQPAGAATNTWDAGGGNSLIEEGGGVWAVGLTNWFDGATYDQVWADGNAAVFGGGAGGLAGTVAIVGTVNASGVTLNDPFAGNYTLGGAGILNAAGLLTKNGAATATLGGTAAINIGIGGAASSTSLQITGGKLVIETTVTNTDNRRSSLTWGADLEIKGNGSFTAGGSPQFLWGNITLRGSGLLGLYGHGNFELQDGYNVSQPTTLTVLDNATFEVDRVNVHGYVGAGGIDTRGLGGFCYGLQWNKYSTCTIDQQGGTVNLTNPMDGFNPWGPGLVLAINGTAGTINIDHKYNLSGGVLNVSGVINLAPFAPTGPTNSAGNGWAPVFNFNGGTMRASQSDSTAQFDIAKGWNHLMANLWHAYVQAGGAIIDTQNFTCSIDQALEHDPALGGTPDGGLRKLGDGTLTLLKASTYTGNTTIDAGTLILADNAQLKFVTGPASGVNNSITGAGTAVLDGDFHIDTALTDAADLTTGTWQLENVTSLTGAYGSTFQVVDSNSIPWRVTGDQWTKIIGNKQIYTFEETTGTLTVGAYRPGTVMIVR